MMTLSSRARPWERRITPSGPATMRYRRRVWVRSDGDDEQVLVEAPQVVGVAGVEGGIVGHGGGGDE